MIIMAKEKSAVGLSRDYIIHSGETLAEIIEDKEMTQRELAVRTGMTEKHISTVIHGKKIFLPHLRENWNMLRHIERKAET